MGAMKTGDRSRALTAPAVSRREMLVGGLGLTGLLGFVLGWPGWAHGGESSRIGQRWGEFERWKPYEPYGRSADRKTDGGDHGRRHGGESRDGKLDVGRQDGGRTDRDAGADRRRHDEARDGDEVARRHKEAARHRDETMMEHRRREEAHYRAEMERKHEEHARRRAELGKHKEDEARRRAEMWKHKQEGEARRRAEMERSHRGGGKARVRVDDGDKARVRVDDGGKVRVRVRVDRGGKVVSGPDG